jgi:hypothetical protein
MYTKVGENWISVINNMHYPSEIGYLPPFNEFPPGMATSVSPNIPDLSMPQTIRIVIIGYYENSEEDLVGAYLDIKLLP